MKNYFIISGLAAGDAFCNREHERKKLQYNIDTGASTLVISPRRYGKTSLIHQALNESGIPFAHVDLYKALTEQHIVDFILAGIGRLLGLLEPKPEKLLRVAKEFFSGLEVDLTSQDFGVAIKFNRQQLSPVEILIQALEKLEAYAQKKKQKAVLYLDEFQSVYQAMRDNYSIEAAIREVAQRSTAVIYFFSGSTRHIVDGMFNDKARPFYRLCDIIYLKRIQSEYYHPYIDHAAQEKWGQSLSSVVIDKILTLTENYPYYVNKLCHLLWAEAALPTAEAAEEAWVNYALESKMSIDKQLDELSLNQKRIMVYLCQGAVKKPFSQGTAQAWQMNVASIRQALTVLVEKDHVYQRESDGCYAILDPLVRTTLYYY